MMMEGLDVIPSYIKDVEGDIGEVNIDYEDEDLGSLEVLGKPHKVDLNICFDNAAFDEDWKSEFANVLIELGLKIKRNGKVSDDIKDANGNTVGGVKVTP